MLKQFSFIVLEVKRIIPMDLRDNLCQRDLCDKTRINRSMRTASQQSQPTKRIDPQPVIGFCSSIGQTQQSTDLAEIISHGCNFKCRELF